MERQKPVPNQVREDSRLVDSTVSALEEKARKQAMRFDEEEHETRKELIGLLKWISILWLCFTVIVVVLHGFRCSYFTLSDSVMIAFLTTSLGTVLGLWGIGLGYYFVARKSK